MTGQDRPADTRMMCIVHRALARDLGRLGEVLGRTPPPAAAQRTAVAEHVEWTMGFLRAHHESEDVGLYPVVRRRRPDATPVLDRMDADHREVAGAVEAVEAAARRYGGGDDPVARTELAAALERLTAVLLPHLQREEDLALPIVSACLTDAEWRAIEHEHNVAPKGMAQLAEEGHWLIDGAPDEDRAAVLGLVPAVPRFVLLHGFARRYRRERDQWWQPPHHGRRVQKHGRTEVVVDADAEAVWEVVLDIPRTGEWSHECVSCELLGGATRVGPGVRFRGRNRQGSFRWGRVCEVVSTDHHELVWRTVPTTLYPDSTEWAIRVTPVDGGTRIEQRFDVVRAPKVLDVVYGLVLPAHRDRTDALAQDLERLAALARSPAREQRPSA
jgi:hemerythrin-like domain-containing protein